MASIRFIIKGFILHLIYFLFQINVYFLSLILPFHIVKYALKFNFLVLIFSIVIAFYAFLFCFMFIIAIFMYPLRKALKEGIYSEYSKQGILYIILIQIYFTIYLSPFINFIHRSIFLYAIFYKLVGLKTKGFFIINDSQILDPWFTEIGDNVILGGSSIISAHSGEAGKLLFSKVKIGNDVTVGGNSLISPGCEIGDNSIIGYGSALKKNTKVGKNELWYGFPAKFVKKIKKNGK